jgi:ADP-glucose pyrophosphorylase
LPSAISLGGWMDQIHCGVCKNCASLNLNRYLKRAAEWLHNVKRPGITLSILQNKPQENKKYKKIQ